MRFKMSSITLYIVVMRNRKIMLVKVDHTLYHRSGFNCELQVFYVSQLIDSQT